MCTKITGFDLKIFVSTGARTAEYKKVLANEIKAQSLNYTVIEDLSNTNDINAIIYSCLLYTSPSPRDVEESRMPSSA